MILNDFFDGIYCISLDGQPDDRWNSNCLPQFEKQQINNVIKVDGFYGRDIDLPINIHRKCELGSCIAHLNAIKRAYNDGCKKPLILEDDVVFINDLNVKFDEVYDQIPDDYDMLYFGGNNVGGLFRVGSKNNLFKIMHTYALQMYSVSEYGYDFIIPYLENHIEFIYKNPLKALEKYPSFAGDYFLALIQPSLNCYEIKPNNKEGYNFSWQMDDNYSEIQQTNVSYPFLKK